MDEPNIETLSTKTKTPLMRLVSVPPGCVCRLVGIVRDWHGRGRRMRGHGRGRHGHDHARMHRFSGRDREMLRRLMDLGLTRGCVFKVVQGDRNGPVLVEVRGTRIALGHGIASRLLVAEASCEI